ncbi:MAG: hypothetical protein H6996_03205 [Moraxellaceae bacterium]|nr:hypothetical protein [Moraxellaceae bacterium]
MQKGIILGGGLTLLAALVMTGCEINDDVNPVPGSTTTVTVTPSLGKILNAKVVLKNAKTGKELGSGGTGNTGIATFTAQKTSDPVVVEVMGQAGAKYFDESKGEEVDFDAGKQIRAALPMLEDKIGVSTLTEVAYQAAEKKAGPSSALSAEIISGANEAIRKALAPELENITTPPHLVGSVADLATIANNAAGKYALKLAALAKIVPNTDATPALTFLNQLAADLEDGKLDGVTTKDISLGYNDSNFVSKITANLESLITDNANLTGLDLTKFHPVFGDIVITIGGSGSGSGSGSGGSVPTGNFNLTIETTVSGLGSLPIPTVTIQNIPKPDTQDVFCNDSSVKGALPSGAITITGCSFSGNVGTISVQLNQGISLSYTVKYTYTPV